MRRTKVWALSLPPALAEKAEKLARKEHRSRSELVREALRQYIASREREALQAVAARRAQELGANSEDAVEEIIEVRSQRSVLELQGLGKEVWKGIDAGEYVEQERASWDG